MSPKEPLPIFLTNLYFPPDTQNSDLADVTALDMITAVNKVEIDHKPTATSYELYYF